MRHKTLLIKLLILTIFLWTQPAGAAGPTQDTIIAIVNKEAITLKDLRQYLSAVYVQLQAQGRSEKESKELMEKYEKEGLSRLIEDRLYQRGGQMPGHAGEVRRTGGHHRAPGFLGETLAYRRCQPHPQMARDRLGPRVILEQGRRRAGSQVLHCVLHRVSRRVFRRIPTRRGVPGVIRRRHDAGIHPRCSARGGALLQFSCRGQSLPR